MSIDPAHPAATQLPDTDATALFAAPARGPAEGAYGVGYAEDSFDYPSPAPAQSWSDGRPPLGAALDAAPPAGVDGAEEGQSASRGHARETGWWERVADWPRWAVIVAAALVITGGFGLSLSMVSDTVSSDPAPGASGGTSEVTVPQSPAVPDLPPQATASASSPAGGASGGVSVSPTGTSPLPGAGGQDRQEDNGRGDGDSTNDG
ncbi:hypothetical protein [Streptomyces sp. NPDC001100]